MKPLTIPMFGGLIFLSACSYPVFPTVEVIDEQNDVQIMPITAEADIGSTKLYLEVAETPEQRALGLQFRRDLVDDVGMLFTIEPEQPVEFWMKNVKVPLDILFIRDGVVQHIIHRASPCVPAETPCPLLRSGVPVDQVIEVKGGFASENNVVKGSEIKVVPLEVE